MSSSPSFFNSGLTIACFQFGGKTPCDNERFTSVVMMGSSSVTNDFNTFVGKTSISHDFVCMELIFFPNHFHLMFKIPRILVHLLAMVHSSYDVKGCLVLSQFCSWKNLQIYRLNCFRFRRLALDFQTFRRWDQSRSRRVSWDLPWMRALSG